MKPKHSIRPARFSPAILTTLALVVGGCGEGPPQSSSSTEEATIKGTVTVKGKKATQGKVFFDPSNKARPTETARVAEIGKDGSYSAKSLVGENVVRFDIPGMEKDRDLGSIELTFEVKPGENEYPIEIPPPGQ